MTKDVAIVFDDATEFYAMRNSIDLLRAHGISVDIYVLDSWKNMSEYYRKLIPYTISTIRKLGYEVRTKYGGLRYKILLEPYIGLANNLKHEYRIKYFYGLGQFSKPYRGDTPDLMINYDAVMVASGLAEGALAAYTKTLLVAPFQYKNFKKRSDNFAKPTLIYLPTFGEESSIDDMTDEIFAKIRDKYHLVIKSHHATQLNPTEQSRVDILRRNADEYYDQNVSIVDLLGRADVVLSDNSGAIFDAIYTNTPVVVFAKNLNAGSLGKLNTLQYELSNAGLLPYASSGDAVLGTIEKAHGNLANIKKMRDEIIRFKDCNRTAEKEYVEIIRYYLNQNRNDDKFVILHDMLKLGWQSGQRAIAENKDLREQINDRDQRILQLNAELQSHLSIKRSSKLLLGNIKRRIQNGKKR